MSKNQVLLIIFCINIVISLIYFFYIYKKEKDLTKAILGGCIILFTMGFGAMFFMLSSIYYNLVSKKLRSEVNFDDLSFSKQKKNYYNLENVEEAINKVPLEEAVMVSDKKSARRHFLSLLKDNYDTYITFINEAISDKDSEISHYAATAIVDIISRFKKSFEEVQNTPIDEYDVEMFIVDTVEFLKSGVLSKHDFIHYADRIDQLALGIELTSEIICHMVSMYLHINNVEKAKEWIDRLETIEIIDLYTYKTFLKYYFETREKEQFQIKLKELKDSDIQLDNQMLELIRMYI